MSVEAGERVSIFLDFIKRLTASRLPVDRMSWIIGGFIGGTPKQPPKEVPSLTCQWSTGYPQYFKQTLWIIACDIRWCDIPKIIWRFISPYATPLLHFPLRMIIAARSCQPTQSIPKPPHAGSLASAVSQSIADACAHPWRGDAVMQGFSDQSSTMFLWSIVVDVVHGW